MKKARKKHLKRQESKSFWKDLDERTREVLMRANSISGKGVGKNRRATKRNRTGSKPN